MMNCPACDHSLTEIDAGGVKVDICKGGCGGIWLDNYEFKKFDEPHEAAGSSLLEIETNSAHKANKDSKHPCPRCQDIIMRRHFVSTKHEVEVDECSRCGGIWLDTGELGQIRNQFKTEEERGVAAEKYFADVFDSDLMKVQEESADQLQKSRRFANMFKFITPSSYIPGNQDGGAF